MTLLNVSLTNSTRCPNAGNFARAFRQTVSDASLGNFITNYILKGGEARRLMSTIRHKMTNYDAILDNYRDTHSGRMDYLSQDLFHDEVNAQIVRTIRSYAVSIINGQTNRIAELEEQQNRTNTRYQNERVARYEAQEERDEARAQYNSLAEALYDLMTQDLTQEERDAQLTRLAEEHWA